MDGLIIEKEFIKNLTKKGHGRQAYLGVYTNDSEQAVYSLVM
jgi:hypothetical protein